MAVLDISLYVIAVIVLLLTIYTFPSLHQLFNEKSLSKIPFSRSKVKVELRLPESSNDIERTVEKEPQFSTSWWTDPQLFELEKRAIFSKNWHFTTHASRFHAPGDYLTLSLGGYSIFLILGKDHILRAFHNVCRHRAYEVTRKECGTSTVLGCRYHGWSYDTRGRLIKAPQFEHVSGFEKEKNSLWEVNTKVAGESGLVFVNLDAGVVVPELETEEMERKIKGWKMDGLRLVEEWKEEGKFNWKLGVGSNIGAPPSSVSKLSPFASLMKFIANPITAPSTENTLHLPPTTSIYYLPHYSSILTITLHPLTPQTTKIHTTLYARPSSTPLPPLKTLLKAKLHSDIRTLETLQRSLLLDDDSKEIEEDSRPGLLDEQLQAQSWLQGLIREHEKFERSEGREVHPASRQTHVGEGGMSKEGREDDDLCRSLDRAAAAAAIKEPAAETAKTDKGEGNKEVSSSTKEASQMKDLAW